MQAVIALCHFCENHGPRVVMTCQPMRSNTLANTRQQTISNKTEEEAKPSYYGEILQGEMIDEDPRCEACSSLGINLGIISNDHDAKISYCSTQMPINDQVYQIVKETCLRSLSVEVATPLFSEKPEHESFSNPSNSQHRACKEAEDDNGLVLYGDRDSGYTLSYTFKLRDAKARGFQRLYALMVVTADEMMLLNNYDFFRNGFTIIINRLQQMATERFKYEQSQSGDVPLETAAGRMMYLPTGFFPRKVLLDTSRSLMTIMNDDNIFYVLHRQMLYLLRAQSTLLKDTVLEGIPTQDMLVAMEREPETLEEMDLITSMTRSATRFYIYNLQKIAWRLLNMDEKLLVSLIWTVILGDQLVVKSDCPAARKLFLLSLVHLLPVGCVRISSNSQTYVDQYKHNFLGLNLHDGVVPNEHMDTAFVVQLHKPYLSSTVVNNDLNAFELEVENCPIRTATRPGLLQRYLELLKDRSLNEAVLEAAIKSTRNDWLKNAKLLFQLSRQREKIDLDRVVRILQRGQEDSPVLLFFQAGLSRRYRQVVLNTIISANTSNSS